MSSTPQDLYLNDSWSLYFHDPHSNDWTTSSYEKIGSVSTVDEYWTASAIIAPHITKGIFFLMRDGIFPCWDDEANIHGGCLSMKILKKDMPGFWDNLASYMLTDSILNTKKDDGESEELVYKVNGISTSPKKHFCIVKIWVGGTELSDPQIFKIPYNYHGEIIYKSNMDNINYENISKGR